MAGVEPNGTVHDRTTDAGFTGLLALVLFSPAAVLCTLLHEYGEIVAVLLFGGLLYLPYGIFLLGRLRAPARVTVTLCLFAMLFGIVGLVSFAVAAVFGAAWKRFDFLAVDVVGVLAALVFGLLATALLTRRGRPSTPGRWGVALLPAAGLVAGSVVARLITSGDPRTAGLAGAMVLLGWHIGAWLQLVLEYARWGRLPLAAPGCCTAFGYDLGGLSDVSVCPECGTRVGPPPDEPIDTDALRELAGGGP